MVILHNAIKNNSEWGLCVFFQNKNNYPFLKKKQKTDLKTGWLDFLKKPVFFSTLTSFQSIFVIFP